ncbi:MAG: hypothetical protein KC435_06130 [Thermomicrobiales bacterium]|nr:hypothetical protein [Thermomicrobiales bacterium]
MNINNPPDFESHQLEDSNELSMAEKLNQAMDDEHIKLRDAIVNLSKIATLTIADTYSTEEMGVEFSQGRSEQIQAERNRLNQTLGKVSSRWSELSDTLHELQRGVGSLQYMIDPENK